MCAFGNVENLIRKSLKGFLSGIFHKNIQKKNSSKAYFMLLNCSFSQVCLAKDYTATLRPAHADISAFSIAVSQIQHYEYEILKHIKDEYVSGNITPHLESEVYDILFLFLLPLTAFQLLLYLQLSVLQLQSVLLLSTLLLLY